MRLSSLAIVSGLLLVAGIGEAVAAPVELICKYNGNETHLYIDLEAGTATWFDQVFHADVTDTQVHWTGILPTASHGRGPDIDATFDRDTGTLVVYSPAGSDPDTGIRWGEARTTWACAKAQKIL